MTQQYSCCCEHAAVEVCLLHHQPVLSCLPAIQRAPGPLDSRWCTLDGGGSGYGTGEEACAQDSMMDRWKSGAVLGCRTAGSTPRWGGVSQHGTCDDDYSMNHHDGEGGCAHGGPRRRWIWPHSGHQSVATDSWWLRMWGVALCVLWNLDTNDIDIYFGGWQQK